ncbi:MAG TPA: tRNA (adenosine(37)-N6)-dimethylallyltransferase MiaA [Dehalococcoidia bacterium]|nr:tRNA (adenosine(37)-N6)-dimethylallyltransferase MiaA [Dehalococcoidia bacterium]
MKSLVAIVGPTGTGKSRLALHLARNLNAEIVSADSRQVYRYLDIGTAKPTREELSAVPHHLIDIIDPDEDFSLAQYQQLAGEAIAVIQQRGKLPLLVGGSGLYVWAVLEGWQIPRVPPDTEFRNRLEKQAAEVGGEQLYQELLKADPVAAQRIDPHNVRRVIRALEVSQRGSPVSKLSSKGAAPYDYLIIGLTTDRAELYRRIDARVDDMIERGLVDEVKRLVEMGYGFDLPAMSGIGYRQVGMYLRGELDLAQAIEKIKVETHRLVRQQYNWFRLKDERIRWLDIRYDIEGEAERLIREFVR